MDEAEQIAEELADSRAGSASSIVPLVYDQLKGLAGQKLALEPAGATLSPTVLVHDAYLRVVKNQDEKQWDGRGHFYVAAAEAMRRILIDRARRRKAIKHGGDLHREVFDSVMVPADRKSEELLAIHEVLDELDSSHPRQAELVKLRYFVGLTIDEASEALGISHATAERDWAYARAWLRVKIAES